MDFYYYTLILIISITILQVIAADENNIFPSFSSVWAIVVSIFVCYKLAFFPMIPGDDKSNYLLLFNKINGENFLSFKDIGFSFYVYISRLLVSNGTLFFILTAVIYLLGYWLIILRNINQKYAFIVLLMVFSSFGFAAYGVNVIRAGFALSMLLIAITFRKNVVVFIIFGLLAVLSHKSTSIPLVAFIVSHYITRHKLFLAVWIFALLLSFLNIGAVSQFLQNNIFSFDDRSANYFDVKNALRYKTGFRTDFVIYSFIPIVVSYYYIYKLKVQDRLYTQLVNTYLFTNAIWLLVIRMAFTDRVAYLSWFLIPFLILYPVLKYKLPINQRLWVATSLAISISFTTYMYFK